MQRQFCSESGLLFEWVECFSLIPTSEYSYEELSASRVEGFLEQSHRFGCRSHQALLLFWFRGSLDKGSTPSSLAVYNTPGQGNRYDPLISRLGDST